MDSNRKIDLINAYRQLQGLTLKLSKSTDEEITDLVQKEFQEFVTSRIEQLLNGSAESGESPPASRLTEEDIEIVLALIENVKLKQKLNNAPAPKPVPPQVNQVRNVSSNAKPLKDADPTGERYRSANETLLSRLAKMDNQGPEF
jgi:hypothetical protein